MQPDGLSFRHHDPLVERIYCITRYAVTGDADIGYLESLAEKARDIVGAMVERGIDPDDALEEALSQVLPEGFGDVNDEELLPSVVP